MERALLVDHEAGCAPDHEGPSRPVTGGGQVPALATYKYLSLPENRHFRQENSMTSAYKYLLYAGGLKVRVDALIR
jgi:hypothetical protein